MNRKPLLIGMVLLVVVLAGCATHYAPDVVNDPYGFFAGIWHGVLFPWALFVNIISWFAGLIGFSVLESIQIIGRPNTGIFYYVGFVMGLSAYGSSSQMK